jgi:hypothetical protein
LSGTSSSIKWWTKSNIFQNRNQILELPLIMRMIPLCCSLALALTTQNTPPNSEALSLLSSIAQSKDSNAQHVHAENPDLMAPPTAPQEYVEWEFQGMNLAFGGFGCIDCTAARTINLSRFGRHFGQNFTLCSGRVSGGSQLLAKCLASLSAETTNVAARSSSITAVLCTDLEEYAKIATTRWHCTRVNRGWLF